MGLILSMKVKKENDGYFPTTRKSLEEAVSKYSEFIKSKYPYTFCESRILNDAEVELDLQPSKNGTDYIGDLQLEMCRFVIECIGTESTIIEFHNSY